jgi:hypothetical protein
VRAGFDGALAGDATVGERIAHAPNRDEQLAGEVWFYYGSRFGEYLDNEKDPQAEGYLEAELEHTPESAKAYARLADYSADAGRADAALTDYRHSLDLKRDQPAVLDSIAALEWKQGHQAEALATWQLAVKQLAAEMDARHVPESFWGNFALVLGDAFAHGQYAAISPQVDSMLRVYLARNGVYRVEPLLEAGYHAHGDSMAWLLEISTAATDPADVLSTVQQSKWVAKNQTSLLLARIVELERRKAQGKTGEMNWSLESAENHWVDALLDEKKFAEARAELMRIPEAKRISSQWLDTNLRLQEADGHLAQLIAEWKKNPEAAPASGDLRNAIRALSAPSKRMVMRLVYQRALDARELTAPNFLGLAAIDLEESDAPGALALLKRLTLISDNPWADTDSAASLLEAHGRNGEAMQFLQPLTEAFPWDANYKIRLAAATLAVNAQSPQALETLAAVAADPKAKYAERMTAAKALKGHGAANPATGSAELDLLARGGCPTGDEADKPFFVEARIAAASCATNDKERERILHAAIGLAPGNQELRIKYLPAAFGAGMDARALVAAEPILENGGSFYGQRYAQGYDSFRNEGYYGQNKIPTLSTLKPENAAKLAWFAIHAREKRQENDEALRLVRSALSSEQDSARRHAFDEEKKRLDTNVAREVENQARAPKIHAALDQDRVVRPRLLPGMPFTPKKEVDSELDGEEVAE